MTNTTAPLSTGRRAAALAIAVVMSRDQSGLVTASRTATAGTGQVAGPRVSCAALLTDVEVSSVVGRPAPPAQVQETATGSTQCRWEWSDTGTIATAAFADESAIRARAAVTKCCPNPNAQVVDQFFDYSLRVEQELGSDLPVPLTGVGQRAALFFDDVFLKLIVQRPDGVAQLVGANLPREQLLALGRALAAP